ncbi:hypothetical protein [Jatrophihabitans fulvus]
MPDSVWGADGSTPEPSAPRVRKAPVEPVPDWLRSTPDPDAPEPAERDPVAVLAVASGFVGIVLFGLLLAVVTGVLGAWAGQRARESKRSYELPYLALGLAFVDGVVWVALHLLFDIPSWLG